MMNREQHTVTMPVMDYQALMQRVNMTQKEYDSEKVRYDSIPGISFEDRKYVANFSVSTHWHERIDSVAVINAHDHEDVITFVKPKPFDISTLSTEELVLELEKREGVEHFAVIPHEDFSISMRDDFVKSTGPAVILIVKD